MTAPLVLLLALLGIGSLPAPRPRLVVVITVDQLRPDYLDRYRSQLTGGLALLLKQGAVFTEAYQDHAVTETAPGHSTILSGRWPAHTGIVRNTAGVQDSTAPLVGVTGLGASPARFRGTALFDWLKAAEPGARALSVSGKDRGAILPLGRAKEQVYWYAGGYFTTSRYYADSLPEWVRVFNGRRIPFKAAGANWNLLLPARAYPEPDSEPYENSGKDFTFPHRLSPDSAQAALEYLGVPSMDSLTLAFALEGVRALALGSRGAVDLLSVSLSTTDYVGHAYGPDSREIHDQVLRLDRSLGLFLQQLFVRYGSGNVLIVLTADHGVTPFPERSRAEGHRDAQRVNVHSMIAAVAAPRLARLQGRCPCAPLDGRVVTEGVAAPDGAVRMVAKLTADQQRRAGEIRQFQTVVEHVAKLVAELDSNRAAKATFIDNLCESIARQLSQLRQRALTSGIGTIADVAGAMSGMAGRGGGIHMKIRGPTDG